MRLSNVSRIASSKRVVIKVGSSSITGENESQLDLIVDLAVRLMRDKEVILVSSGAIATASPIVGLSAKPEDLATSQALASIGQARLMSRYEASLSRYGKLPGQVLLTVDNLSDSTSAANALGALERLIELDVLPIINENDSVATQEIRFGDNDQLAAQVAALVHADLLILFSDIEALYTKPPTQPGAEPIAVVPFEGSLDGVEIEGSSTGYGTGGALTKVAAARLATASGTGVILTATKNAVDLDVTPHTHTWFEPKA
jgi:glutamate 5-kinase